MADKTIVKTTASGTMVEHEEKDVSTPADFTSPDVLYQDLMESVKKYHPSSNLSDIEAAYRVAYEAHKTQFRKSGEPYIIHPLCVAIILSELELDKESIIAGLLHDVIEDTAMTYKDVANQFGVEVAELVDGVTKLTRLNYKHDKIETQAENLRKMFLAMAKDIRVILIKLADRLHNMRTMQYQSPAKQIEKSRETLEIYSPLAHRLGISKIKIELDDLSMQYLMPDVYQSLNSQVNQLRPRREAFIKDIIEQVGKHISTAGIEAEVDGRVKHFFSIYRKMVTKHKTLDQIYDIFAVRVKVDSVKDCYAALGIIHEMFTPIPGRFKDYIAMPKPNMYQSLHTTLLSSDGQPFEVQIRTYEMHRVAEYGIAAHWKYKEGGKGVQGGSEEAKMAWLRQILEWQKDMSDNKEFLSSVKNDLDLFSDNVFCFTPSGDVKNLPAGSTPVDFAYAIHSAVGNKMVGARVNGQLVPIDYQIKNGDRIEIITSQNSRGPSMDWLNIVKSTQARNKINQWFKKELKAENIQHGHELLAQYCKNHNINASELMTHELQAKALNKYGFKDWDSLCASVGHGGLKEGQVVNKLLDELNKKKEAEISDEDILVKLEKNEAKNNVHFDRKGGNGITVKGISDVSVHFSKCCNPVPGDEIIGYITRGRGITIHRTDCVNVFSLPEAERARLIEAEWENQGGDGRYIAEINVYADNRTGLIIDISKIFSDAEIDLKFMNSRVNKKGEATISLGFDVKNKEQLSGIVAKLRKIQGVRDVTRATG